jgi:hypothetical protein
MFSRVVDVVHRLDFLFELLRNLFFHFLRARPRINRYHHCRGDFDLGIFASGNGEVVVKSPDDDKDRNERDHDAVVQGPFRKVEAQVLISRGTKAARLVGALRLFGHLGFSEAASF